MFSTWRWGVVHKTQTGKSKVKVTHRGQRSQITLINLVLTVSWSYIEGFQNNLAKMFKAWRRCVGCKTQTGKSKVKVTHRGQRSQITLINLVLTVSWSYIEGFQNNLAKMFKAWRQCVGCKTLVHNSKVKVTNTGQRSKNGTYTFSLVLFV